MIVPSYIIDMFSLHTIDMILYHKCHWIYPYEKQTQGNKLYFSMGRKYGLSHSIKNVTTAASFAYTLKRQILSRLCG